jgi:hypothetical protein
MQLHFRHLFAGASCSYISGVVVAVYSCPASMASLIACLGAYVNLVGFLLLKWEISVSRKKNSEAY